MLVFCGVLFCVNLLCRVCYWFFPFVVLFVSFSQKSNCLAGVCLSYFWFVMFSFLDLSIVFKRIKIIGSLSWFSPIWVLWVFFSWSWY